MWACLCVGVSVYGRVLSVGVSVCVCLWARLVYGRVGVWPCLVCSGGVHLAQVLLPLQLPLQGGVLLLQDRDQTPVVLLLQGHHGALQRAYLTGATGKGLGPDL